MRLIPLKNHQHLFDACLQLYTDYLLEQGVESTGAGNREAVQRECLDKLTARLVDSNREIFLFEKGRFCVGFAEVAIEERCFPDEDLPESCVRIVAFYIAPQERRQKLGSTFFKFIRDWGRDKRAQLIEVEAPLHVPGLPQFLQQQGLELAGTGVKNCYRAFT